MWERTEPFSWFLVYGMLYGGQGCDDPDALDLVRGLEDRAMDIVRAAGYGCPSASTIRDDRGRRGWHGQRLKGGSFAQAGAPVAWGSHLSSHPFQRPLPPPGLR